MDRLFDQGYFDEFFFDYLSPVLASGAANVRPASIRVRPASLRVRPA